MDALFRCRCGVKAVKAIAHRRHSGGPDAGECHGGDGQSSGGQIMSSSSVDSRAIISSFLHVLSNVPVRRLRLWYETRGRVEEVAIRGES